MSKKYTEIVRTASCFHRKELLASDYAACFNCLMEFKPEDIKFWCENGKTAICPYCDLDSVVGFSGGIDREWLEAATRDDFPYYP